MQIAFGRVRRKTEPTGPGAATVVFSKIDSYGAVGMQIAFGRVRRKTEPGFVNKLPN